jgi:hypothetical protein
MTCDMYRYTVLVLLTIAQDLIHSWGVPVTPEASQLAVHFRGLAPARMPHVGVCIIVGAPLPATAV